MPTVYLPAITDPGLRTFVLHRSDLIGSMNRYRDPDGSRLSVFRYVNKCMTTSFAFTDSLTRRPPFSGSVDKAFSLLIIYLLQYYSLD
jgi:hypothetical protein